VVVLLSPWGLAGGGLLGCATSKSQGCTRQCLPPTVSHLGPPGSAHQPCGTATIGCSLTAVRCAPKGLDISSGTWMTKTPPHDFCVSGCLCTSCAGRARVVRASPNGSRAALSRHVTSKGPRAPHLEMLRARLHPLSPNLSSYHHVLHASKDNTCPLSGRACSFLSPGARCHAHRVPQTLTVDTFARLRLPVVLSR
jgi:hypothetical protein